MLLLNLRRNQTLGLFLKRIKICVFAMIKMQIHAEWIIVLLEDIIISFLIYNNNSIVHQLIP